MCQTAADPEPAGLPGALNANVVREIRADSYGNIWIGTEDAGLMKFDNKSKLFSNFTDGSNHIKIGSRNIQGLLVDDDNLWIGTFDNGIYLLNIPTEKITKHFDLRDGRSGLKTNSLITFLKTADGTIFAGSVIGLYRFNRETSSFKFMDDVAAGTFIHSLNEDHNRIVWIGTYGSGLFKYERSTGVCKKILPDREDYSNLTGEGDT